MEEDQLRQAAVQDERRGGVVLTPCIVVGLARVKNRDNMKPDRFVSRPRILKAFRYLAILLISNVKGE